MVPKLNMVLSATSLGIIPLSGVLVDRVSHRKLMFIQNIWLFIITLGLGFILLTGHAKVPYLFVFAFLCGMTQTINMTLGQVVIFDLVPRNETPNAIAIVETGAHLTPSFGPALSHHINQTILRLCTNLHKENYSNIVMFVSYLSKDPIVLDLLIANADRLFTDVLPCDLDKNVGFINKLEPHKIITSFSDVPEEQSREAVLRSQDHVERDASKSLISQGEVDDIDKLEVVPSIVYSFALINILGQILRNYLGTMDSTHKQKIVDTSYRLGLRVLELAFINMEGDLSHLKQHFMESVRAKNKRITEHELDTRFTNYISATTILLSMLVVRSVTLAVGAPELDQVYEDVQKQLDLPSIALLNMSLQLEHYKGHPVKQVIEMHKAAKKNPFLSELIRQLVLLNLYLYPWPALERQKVLAEFGMQKTQNWPRFLLPKGKLIKKVDPRA